MSQVQTLAELMAQAEAEDNPDTAAVVEQVEDAEPEDEQEPDEESSSNDEESEEEKPETEAEEWAKPDTKNFVPAKVHSELRKNLRAVESDVNTFKAENEQLKQRLAELENGTKNTETLKAPTLADCDYDDNLHAQKLAEYSEKVIERKLSEKERQQTLTAQQQQAQQRIDSEVNKHYERAEALVSAGKISADNFKASEVLVRKAFAESSQVDPDYLTDYFISLLGEGSEKVIAHLGVSVTALSKLKETLKFDPTGLQTAAYLGSLKEKFNSASVNKLSNAPKPDKALSGSVSVSSGSARSAYLKAEKSGDVSAMLAAKRQAKVKGIDTSKW